MYNMAVDPEYVERVVDEEEIDYESVLEDFGIEASNEGGFEPDNGIDTEGYTKTYLRDMWDNDDYFGRPVLSDVYTTEFTNKQTGETTVNHKMDVLLFEEYNDEKDVYIFPINLKSENIDFDKGVVKDVHNSSGLYALAMGLMELKAPNISKAFNFLNVVGIKKLQKQVNGYTELGIKVVEKSFPDKVSKEEKYYNSFRIIEGKKE